MTPWKSRVAAGHSTRCKHPLVGDGQRACKLSLEQIESIRRILSDEYRRRAVRHHFEVPWLSLLHLNLTNSNLNQFNRLNCNAILITQMNKNVAVNTLSKTPYIKQMEPVMVRGYLNYSVHKCN